MHTFAFTFVLFAAQAFAETTPPASAASQYSLSTSTSIPFPTATLDNSDTQSSSSASGPVLQVQYPAGSYEDSNAGGAQMYALWNSSGSAFQSMMISYEVAFDSGFDWVKGGKLPGLRGGPDPNNCSGGNQANGTNCFSSRLMWRANGAGEVYAYIPRPNNICSESGIECNDAYGMSIDRGSFSFSSGKWNRVTLLVRLNNPTTVTNGQVVLYFNNVKALEHDDLYFRSSDVITTGGMYFS
ncbi:hypothetical protein EI94DRAFT_1713703 [Lactarius quietus]|nr:hypothetical protein EI94DRAFT_1713703 [Lactarius quietus]